MHSKRLETKAYMHELNQIKVYIIDHGYKFLRLSFDDNIMISID